MVDFSDLIIPTLEILYESKKEMSIREIDETLISRLNIGELDLKLKHKDTKQSEFSYRSSWARTYLKKYGLILNISRGIWKISDIYNGENIDDKAVVLAVRNNQVYIPISKLEENIDIIEENCDDIAANNDKYIKELSKKYHNYKVALFLGAGVSMSANMPSWDELVASFLVNRFRNESKKNLDDNIVDELARIAKLNSDNSPISQTRFIKQNIEPEIYLELLKESIYHNEKSININNDLFEVLTNLIRYENCVYIKDIITFNFDNLLERKFEQKYIAYQKFTNYEEIQNQNYVNIYHVHGYIDKEATPDEVDLERIIFSEEQYHKMYNDVYNLSNIKQINALREKNCLFIGCSLSDPNMRRLLDIAYDKSEAKHYAILKKEDIKLPNSMSKDSNAYLLYQNFHLKNRNDYFNSLGINVIWIDDYDDIPKILMEIIDIK